MKGIVIAAALFSVAIVVAAFLVGGRYQTVGGSGGVYIVDRFSSNVQYCEATTQPHGQVMCQEDLSLAARHIHIPN